MELRRLDEFSPFVGQEFEVISEHGASRLRLESVRSAKYHGGPGRPDPFYLDFRGVLAVPARQGLFLVRHPEFGETEIVLSFNGMEQGEAIYSALFN